LIDEFKASLPARVGKPSWLITTQNHVRVILPWVEIIFGKSQGSLLQVHLTNRGLLKLNRIGALFLENRRD